jgi:hypothetical protein
MGAQISVSDCDACKGDHASVELYSPPAPCDMEVMGGLALTETPWFICPEFKIAVPVPIKRLA